jgi:serine/threonine-protein kinase RsbT
MAVQLGFGIADQTRLATVVSELTRNVIQYAGNGFCELIDRSDLSNICIQIIVEDHGPGIPNMELAMKDGYSTGNGLGAGLPGTRRLMDHFAIESAPGLTRIDTSLARQRLREKFR